MNSCNFVPVNWTLKQQISSWLLLAIFVPMLFFSSVHVHDDISSEADTECTDCVHHNCHGHLGQTVSWAHKCVLCQFLSLAYLAANLGAAIVYINVCKQYKAQYVNGYVSKYCGLNVTRGPPSFL